MALKISVTLETNGNAAFADDPVAEVARILRQTAESLENSYLDPAEYPIRDCNGNKCGQVVVEENDDD